MLACRDVSEKTSAMVDGELSSWERLELRMHLLMCVNCRRFVKQFTQLVDHLHNRVEQEVEPAPAGFADRVMDAIDASAPQSDDLPKL